MKLVNSAKFESLEDSNAVKQSLGLATRKDEGVEPSKIIKGSPTRQDPVMLGQAKGLVKKMENDKRERQQHYSELRQKEIRRQLKVKQDFIKQQEWEEKEKKLQK